MITWRRDAAFALILAAGSLAWIPGTAPGAMLVLDNPYADVDWSRHDSFKANLHTHTTESDGQLTPAEAIDFYREAGYRILALTDHDLCTWPWTAHGRDPSEVGMVAIPGNELSRRHHVLSLYSDYAPGAYTVEEALTAIAARSGIAAICHPSMEWPSRFAAPSLRIPLSAPLRGMTRGDFTLETWFRTTKAARNVLMGNVAYGATGALNLELHTDNAIRLYLLPPHGMGGAIDLTVPVGETLDIHTRSGEWHHLAATREGDVLTLYLNGQMAAQRGGADVAFDLHGTHFFLGRDTRLEQLDFDGDLDWTRLWRRALNPDEILRLAQGAFPGDPDGPDRDGLLAEYGFETSRGQPTSPGSTEARQVDDTAGHPEGPFHAVPAATGGGTYIGEAPPALARRGRSQRSMRFTYELGRTDRPPEIHPDALTYYLDLYRRHEHLFAIEVINTYSDWILDRELWDRLLERLMPRRPVWGLAVDDMHRPGLAETGWLVIPLPRLREDLVRQALQKGAYTFSTTKGHGGSTPDRRLIPVIERIEHDTDAGRLRVQASVDGRPLPPERYAWISGGRIVHQGPELDYRRTPGLRHYVRAELTGEGGRTFTNPFGLRTAPAASSTPTQATRATAAPEPGRPAPEPAHVPSRTASGVTLTQGLAAYWNFDDGLIDRFTTTAHNARDFRPGRLAGFGAMDAWLKPPDAFLGGALQLDGRSSHVRIPPSDHLDSGLQALTLSIWVKLDRLPSELDGPRAGIFDSDSESYVLVLDRTAKGLRFTVTDESLDTSSGRVSETHLQPGAWHQVAGVFEAGSGGQPGQVRLYLDGRLMDERLGSDATPGRGLAAPLRAGQVSAIGRQGSLDAGYFAGAVDELGIWTRALDDDEIRQVYDKGRRGIPLDR